MKKSRKAKFDSKPEQENKTAQILASKRDQEIFFDALMNPPKPNEALKKAMKQYKKDFDTE